MAQFRAVIQGQRGKASRLGSKSSGISAEVNGWDSGISVHGYYSEEDKMDKFEVVLNEGNGYNRRRERLLGTFTMADLDIPTKKKAEYTVTIDDEFSGYMDYYQGHGHAFEKSPEQGGAVACILLQCSPSSTDTWASIGEELKNDSGTEFEDFTKGKTLDNEAADKAVTDFITRKYQEDGNQDVRPFPDWKVSEDDMDESPTYLIVLHLYEASEV